MRWIHLLMLPVVLAGLVSVVLAGTGGPSAAAPEDEIVSVLGRSRVGGRDVFVHITFIVPAGRDKRELAEAVLAAQGAVPDIESAAFVASGFLWPQFSDASSSNNFVPQYYNRSGQPSDGAATSFRRSQTTWTNVPNSRFTFAYGGSTARCPSLVDECAGAQAFDGRNDVGWLVLGGCCTLGVTWYGIGPSGHEADMALNTSLPWSTTGGLYDIETVFLHENGHVAGLGHSTSIGAVMNASYQGVRRTLACDDISGISALYPDAGVNPCLATPTPTATLFPGGGLPVPPSLGLPPAFCPPFCLPPVCLPPICIP